MTMINGYGNLYDDHYQDKIAIVGYDVVFCQKEIRRLSSSKLPTIVFETFIALAYFLTCQRGTNNRNANKDVLITNTNSQ